MGELHLEIIADRILKKYNIEADTGPLQIAYRESLVSTATDTYSSTINIGTRIGLYREILENELRWWMQCRIKTY